MKRRAAVTLVGVIAAHGLRVIALFGIVATIIHFDVVGGLRIYDIAISALSTPFVLDCGF